MGSPVEAELAKKATRTRAKTAKAAKKRTAAGKKTAARRATTRTAGTKKAAARSKPARRTTKRAAARKKTAVRTSTKGRTTRVAQRVTSRTARRKTAARAASTRQQRREETPPQPSALAAAATVIRGTVAGALAAVTGRLRGSNSEPDAIELLEREHRRFEDLLKQGEETTERARTGRRELLDTLTAALNAHELMEEQVLYPALQSHPQARDIVLEGYQEHHVADVIVKELHEVATDDEQWAAKFKVLKENIEHHIQEEEGEMFRVARGIFSREELQELAARMLALRADRKEHDTATA